MIARRAANRHDALFAEYVAALKTALAVAARDFDASIVRPPLEHAGPIPTAVDPRVIAVICRYFFACDRLNQAEGAESAELPHVFIVERLAGTHDELWKALTELPYLPIGTDDQDRWVE
jgi:hypothetical protein